MYATIKYLHTRVVHTCPNNLKKTILILNSNLLKHFSPILNLLPGITVQFCGRADIFWAEKVKGKGTRCVDTVSHEAHEEYFNIRNSLQEAGIYTQIVPL